jgi:hypothetical protein
MATTTTPRPEALPITLSVADVKYLLSYFDPCDESGHCRCCGVEVPRGDHSSANCKPDCQIKHIRNVVKNVVGDPPDWADQRAREILKDVDERGHPTWPGTKTLAAALRDAARPALLEAIIQINMMPDASKEDATKVLERMLERKR